MLHAGALRWAFFKIEPAQKALVQPKKIMPAQLDRAMKEHMSAIKKAVDEENALDAAIESEFRKSELRPLSYGALKCVPVTGADCRQKLLFTSGKNSLSFELDNCAMKNWQVNGNLWVEAAGMPMFWLPSNAASARYTVTKQDVVKEGILVVAEKLFTRKNSAALEHLTIRHTLLVAPDLRSLKISSALIDSHNAETGGGSFDLGFRYHFFPGNLSGQNGDILLTAKGKELVHKRVFEQRVYAREMGKSATLMNKLFECPKAPVLIDKSTAYLRYAKGKEQLKIQAFPEKLFAGYAVWDTPKQKFPTFEPFFHPVRIENDKSALFSIELKVEKVK